MSQFRKPTYSGRFTVEECDKIALESAGKLGSRGYGYECNPRGNGCIVNDEYAVRTVGTHGMGNYGDDILVGRTPRARAILREGKIRHLVAMGVRRKTAAVAVRHQYGMEVAKLADDLVEIAAVVKDIGPARASFEGATGVDTADWSMPRVWAAWEIAQEVAR